MAIAASDAPEVDRLGGEEQNRRKSEEQKIELITPLFRGVLSAVVFFYDAAFLSPCPLPRGPIGRL
jgi:hypothetical protein